VVCVIRGALAGSQRAALGEHPPACRHDVLGMDLPPQVASLTQDNPQTRGNKPPVKLISDGIIIIIGSQDQVKVANGYSLGFLLGGCGFASGTTFRKAAM